jgi:hypothetical protein
MNDCMGRKEKEGRNEDTHSSMIVFFGWNA